MTLGQMSLYVAAASAREGAARRHAEEPARLRSIASGERAKAMRARLERLGTRRLRDHRGRVTVPSPFTTAATGMAGAMAFGFRRFALASLIGRIRLGLEPADLGDAHHGHRWPRASGRPA